jgi:hypothetical protein
MKRGTLLNFTQGTPHTLKEVLLGFCKFLRDGALLGVSLHNCIEIMSSQLNCQGFLITYCISMFNYLYKLHVTLEGPWVR